MSRKKVIWCCISKSGFQRETPCLFHLLRAALKQAARENVRAPRGTSLPPDGDLVLLLAPSLSLVAANNATVMLAAPAAITVTAKMPAVEALPAAAPALPAAAPALPAAAVALPAMSKTDHTQSATCCKSCHSTEFYGHYSWAVAPCN